MPPFLLHACFAILPAMDIAAEPPMGRPAEAPMLHGQRIDWTPRDVLFGVLWFVAIFFIIPLLPGLIASAVFDNESSELYASLLILGALSEVGIVIVAAQYTFGKYGGSWERLGFRAPRWSTLLWAGIAVVAALAVSIAYSLIIDALDIDALRGECDDQIPDRILDDRNLMVLTTVLTVGFAPVCEETFFRGFTFPGLIWWGAALAIALSAALFSVAHVGPSLHKTLIPIFAIGAIFAFAYLKSGNLLSTILAHLVFNTFAVINLWNCNPS
jgi:membrane protease YdiL (CAAX protease family)